MLKLTFREIKKSFGRYIAILAIVALGVGFFYGLRITKTAMIHTMDVYAEEQKLFDERLLCTLGYTGDEVADIRKAAGIRAAEGLYAMDVLCQTPGSTSAVLHVMSIPSEVNVLDLKAGRMPITKDECIGDGWMMEESMLGKTITISDINDEDTQDAFAQKTFTVVGLANSPLFINYERGNASIGSGSVDAFLCVPPEAFDCDYYTEIAVLLETTEGLSVYTEAYDDAVKAAEDWVTEMAETASMSRYTKLFEDAQGTLNDARATLDEKEQELADAKRELSDAERQLADGKKTIEDSKKEIADAKAEIADGKQKIREGWQAYEDGVAEYEEQKSDAERQLQEAEDALNDAQTQLDSQRETLEQQKAQCMGALAMLPPSSPQLAMIQGYLSQIEDGLTQCAEGQITLEEQRDLLESKKADAKQELEDVRKTLDDAKTELEEKEQKLADAEAELVKGEKELQDAIRKLTSYERELDDARSKLADGEAKLLEAEEEYEDGVKKLNDLEKPDTYVLGRDTNIGYVCYESDSDIVKSVSVVFPLFFFAVAALVCITTMTRMVDEQRTQLGTLKALGYQDRSIHSIYFLYSGSASLLGCCAGIAGGSYILPRMIWMGYNIMYKFSGILFAFDWPLTLLSSGAFLLCAMGATWYAIASDLRLPAAELIRPKAPKTGKRTILERIPFFWNRLKFLHKVSVRNILRYKKRMVMMVIGIGGCTALLITGYGLRDSIKDVCNYQYDEITLYKATVSFFHPVEEEEKENFRRAYASEVDRVLFVSSQVMDLQTEDEVRSVNVVVPEKDSVDGFMSFHTVKGDPLPYPGQGGCLINNNIAEQLHLSVGDRITVTDSEYHPISLTIAGIFKNHVDNYLYITEETYREQLGKTPEYKTAWAFLTDAGEEHELAAAISGDDEVSNVSLASDLRQRINTMMSGMDYIVLVVIVCAAALAFIVLYNLTNINITERAREIATIKVLGFYDTETNWYVFRENLILTVLGALVGVPMGIALHSFVMSKIVIEMISFDVRIVAASYGISVLLTIVFGLMVNLALKGKIRRIDMASALKSIE